MCDPTMLLVAGTITSAIGQFQASSAAAANASFQQQVALDNARRTDNAMKDAQERGADREQQVLSEGANAVANTRGALAANNMDLTFGSPLDTILDTSVAVQRDAYRARRNTASEVGDLETQKYNYLNNATSYGAEATNARSAGFVAGVGTALGGAADVYKYRASIS